MDAPDRHDGEARLEAPEGDSSAVFIGWTPFHVDNAPLWTNFGPADSLVVPAPYGRAITMDLSEYPTEPAVVVSMNASRTPTSIAIYETRAYTGFIEDTNLSGGWLLLIDDGRVRGIVNLPGWSGQIRDSEGGDQYTLEIGWTSVPTIYEEELTMSQLVIEEPDFSHCGNVHVSEIRYDVDRGVQNDNGDYEADLIEMHELSRLSWDDICIDHKMWQIVPYDFNIPDADGCSTKVYRDWLTSGWGNPNMNSHQEWAFENLDGCVAVAIGRSLGEDGNWGASVVEGSDWTTLDFYNPYIATDMNWVSTHENGHNHGVTNPNHYNDCDSGGNVGCNLMYPSVPLTKGYWWTTGAKDQIRSYAYPILPLQ